MSGMSTVSLSGITMGYDDRGAGPALVLVHGHPFDRSMWRPQLERFSRSGRRVIALDLRGYGESTVIPGTTRLETFARDIAALLDHLGIDRAVLAGLSMGGQIVMEFQRLFAWRVAGLVLADTSAQAETEEGKRLRHEAADRLLREGMQPYAEAVLPRMVAPYNLRTMPDVAAHVAAMMQRTSPEGAAAALRGRAERPDYRDVLARATAPALIVVGSDDDFTPLSDAELMKDRLADARVVVIEGAAHMPNLERPDDFNDALDEFLSAVSELA
jgi:pimeloyl-ACP methyl ester carboxylesterase